MDSPLEPSKFNLTTEDESGINSSNLQLGNGSCL